jgi:hypothetical protein
LLHFGFSADEHENTFPGFFIISLIMIRLIMIR